MAKFKIDYYTIGNKNVILLTNLTDERASNLEVLEAVSNDTLYDPRHYLIYVKGKYWWKYFLKENFLSLIISAKETDNIYDIVEKF